MSSFSLLQNSLNRKNNKQTIELLKLGIKSEMNKLSEDQIKSIVSGGSISKLLRRNNTYSDQDMSKLLNIYLKIVKSSRTLTKEENKQCDDLQEQIDKLKLDLQEALEKSPKSHKTSTTFASISETYTGLSDLLIFYADKIHQIEYKISDEYLDLIKLIQRDQKSNPDFVTVKNVPFKSIKEEPSIHDKLLYPIYIYNGLILKLKSNKNKKATLKEKELINFFKDLIYINTLHEEIKGDVKLNKMYLDINKSMDAKIKEVYDLFSIV